MEALRVLLFLLLLVESIDGKRLKCDGCNREFDGVWARRQLRYKNVYKDVDDECEHREAFEGNLEYIANFREKAKRNPRVFTWQVGKNGLAATTRPEFQGMLGLKSNTRSSGDRPTRPPSTFFLVSNNNSTNPSREQLIVDYSADGMVTPVENQGQCGSCWTFASTGAIESQLLLRRSSLAQLSQQELLDCAKEKYNNSGCAGGYMRTAYQFVIDNQGLVTSDVYPYTGIEGECSTPNGTKHYTCRNYQVVEPNENALMRALIRYGPISCGMDGSLESFQLYTEGVFSDSQCSNELNHAVVIIGAGTTAEGTDYWLVKNSWGTDWGEDGFFRLLRGTNLCNIVGDCSFPCFCKAK